MVNVFKFFIDTFKAYKEVLYGSFLKHLPKNAHNVSVHHFLGELFYIIKFKIGEDIHSLNLDVEFPSIRGGTHRTRYYGVLEGVTPKTKELVIQASKKAGKSPVQ